MPRSESNPLLHGTLDALILKTLTWGPRHATASRAGLKTHPTIASRSRRARCTRRSIDMERRGWIDAEWGMSELGRKAKFYRITPKGRRQLAADIEQWSEFAAAVSKVLLPA